MKLVIDTNILIVSISRNSQFHWIFEAIIEGKITLCVTTEILYEYEEIITRFYNKETADYTISALLNSPYIHLVNNYYRWNILTDDYDDNKFIDCYISANAEFIITNDKHFNKINELQFPQVNVISYEEFEKVYKESLL